MSTPPSGSEHAQRAARTYGAAADHYNDPALGFWDRYGAATVGRLPLAPIQGRGAVIGRFGHHQDLSEIMQTRRWRCGAVGPVPPAGRATRGLPRLRRSRPHSPGISLPWMTGHGPPW